MSKAPLFVSGFLLAAVLGAAPGALAGGWTYTTIYQIGSGGAVDYPSINDHGQVVFDAQYSTATASYSQVWSWQPGGPPTLVDSGVVSSFPTTQFASVTVNNSGEIGFSSRTIRTASGNGSETIIVADGKTLTRIAPNIRLPGPGGVGTYYISPSLLDDGSAVFWANGTGHLMRANAGSLQIVDRGYLGCDGSYSSPHGYAAYIGQHGGPINCVAAGSLIVTNALTRTSQILVPDNGFFGTLVQNAEANDQGTAVFSGMNLPGYGGDSVNGLFTIDATGQVRQLAIVNNKHCGPLASGCVWRGYNGSLSINAAGAVAATMDIPAGFGVALNGDIKNGRVAWPGQVINGCRVNYAIAAPRSINAAGQIALFVGCTKGFVPTAEIILATPN